MVKTILVDDEDIIRNGISRFIDWEGLGIELVGEASNGKEAVELFRAVEPDIIITDVKMPRMNGLELLEMAKAKKSDCIVIMISSYDEFKYAQQALNLGAFAYLLKPIDTNRLTELLKEAVKRISLQSSRQELLLKAEKILGDTAEVQPELDLEQGTLSHAVYKAKCYMEEHYQDAHLRLEDVANYVYANPSYFSTIFNKEMKISFGNYLTQIRMKRAMELLRVSHFKIYEIAEQVGYQNVSWFTVAFKKYTGKSPGEYRKSY